MSIFHESIKIKLNVKLKSLTICIAFDLCIRLFHHVYAREGRCNYYPNSYGNSFCHECDKTRGAIVALIFEHRYNHIPTFIPSPKAPKAWRAPTYHHVEHVGWYMDVEMDLTVMIASLPLEIANTIVQFLEILQSILQIVVSPTWALMLKLRFNVSMLINMLYCRIFFNDRKGIFNR